MLTDGVQLGLSRWVRPDDGKHPYRDMIVSYGSTITKDNFEKLLCYDRVDENKVIIWWIIRCLVH